MEKRKRNPVVIALFLVLLVISLLLTNWSGRSTGDQKFILQLVSFTPLLLGILLVIQVRFPGGIRGIKLTKEGSFHGYGVGIIFGALQFLAFVGLSVLLKVNQVSLPTGSIPWGMVLLFALAFVGQTALEEVAVRGVFLQAISRRKNLFVGVIASSLIFSALHIPNGSTTVLSLLNLFLIGVFFCTLVIGSNSLFVSCGAHFAWNFFESSVFTATNSNNVIQSGIFKLSSLSSQDWLTGGSFGPEASILTTVVVLISIALCIYFYKIPLSQMMKKEEVPA